MADRLWWVGVTELNGVAGLGFGSAGSTCSRDGVRVDGSVLPPLPVANTLTCADSSGRHIQDALAVVYQAVRDVFADADSAVYRPQPVREPRPATSNSW